jgi:DNA-binding IclR family transcriptional regulator
MDAMVDARELRSPRSVLARVAHILDVFGWEEPVLTLNELTARTGLPKSTVHRLSEQLVQFGWLERSFSGYRIGMRLFEFGGLAERRNRMRDHAAVYMQRLAAHTGCAVHLAVLDRSEVLCLAKLAGDGVNIPTHEGSRLPVHCTALGKALLAHAQEPELATVLGRGLSKCTTHTIVDEQGFRGELAAVRRHGIATDKEESGDGFVCIAAPIRGAGRAIGAISATGRTETYDWGLNRAEVVATAQAVWEHMFASRSQPGQWQ